MARLVFPAFALIALGVLNHYWWAAVLALAALSPIAIDPEILDPKAPWADTIHKVVAVLMWLFAAALVNRLIDVFVWRGWFIRRSGMEIPKLLCDLLGMFVWLAAIILIIANVFGVDISAVLTGSGIALAVIGFALRNMIADVFTGIALGVERPMRQGDWIELVDDNIIGEVTEINWRATRLVTKENVAVVVPNSFLATHPFLNYHQPQKYFRDKFEIMLSYEVTAHQAERILLAAIAEVPESMEVPRNPQVRIKSYTERGISWEVRYWVPDFNSRSRLRYEVQRHILRNMHYAGVEVPRASMEFLEVEERQPARDQLREELEILGKIDMFRSLDRGEIMQLRENMRRLLCVTGQPVVVQGENESASLFVVKEGFLDVSIKGENGESVSVGRLTPGMFFGEMSLLTGAPRSATVTPSIDSLLFEITSEDIGPLLQGRADLVHRFSEAVADRQLRNNQSMKAASDADKQVERDKLADRVLSGIVGFFGLGRADAAQ